MTGLILALLLAAPAFSNWRERFDAGERLLNAGNTDDARRELTAALSEAESAGQHRSVLAVILDALGRTESRAGRYRPAAGYFQRSLTLCEQRSEAQAISMSNTGQAFLALGDYPRAERLFRSAMEILPESGGIWYLLGQSLLQQGRLPDADKALHRAWNIFGESEAVLSAAVLSDIAALYRAEHNNQQALRTLERAIAIAIAGQTRARIMANLGALSWRLGHKKQAADWLSQALAEMEREAGPGHPDVGRILDDYSFVLEKSGRGAEGRALGKRAQVIRTSAAAYTNDERNTIGWQSLKQRTAAGR